MAVKSNSQRVIEARKNRQNNNNAKSLSSNSGLKNSDIAKRLSYERAINFNTLETDLKTTAKTIGNIYNGWQTKETMENALSSVQSMYDRLGKYQEYQKKYGGTDLTEIHNSYKSILDGWKDLSKTYAPYKSADEYTSAIKSAKEKAFEYEGMKTADLGAVQTEITDLEKILNTVNEHESNIQGLRNRKSTWQSRSRSSSDDGGYDKQIQAAEDELNKYLQSVGYEDTNALKQALGEKKAYKNRAEWVQKGIEMSSVGDESSENYDKDFTQKSKYVPKSKSAFNFSIGVDDDLIYDYINDAEGVRENYRANAESSADASVLMAGYEYMTDDEVSTYNYYYNTSGAKKAKEYLDTIAEDLGGRKAVADFERYEGKTAKELLQGIGAGFDQFASGMKNLFNFTDEYIPTNSVQQLSGLVREDLTYEHGTLGQVGYDLIKTTSNMLPSILTSTAVGTVNPTMGANVGAGLMGASASGNAYQEMLNLGYDKGQARTYSSLVGASEAALQRVMGGISALGGASGKLSKLVSGIDNGLAKFAIRWGGSVLSEGVEEATQEVLTPLFQNLAAGYHTGADVDWSEVVYSGLLGALSGGILEGPGITTNSIQESLHNKRLGQAIKANERSGEMFGLIDGLTPEESEAYAAYTRYANKGITADNISNTQLGNLHSLASSDAMKVMKSDTATEEQKKSAENTLRDLAAYAQKSPASQMTAEDVDEDSLEEMLTQALALDEDTEGYKLAAQYQAKLDKGKKLSTKEIRKLVAATDAVYDTEAQSDVEAQLTELGETGDVSKIADAIMKEQSGKILTTEEIDIIKNSKYGEYVANGLTSEEIVEVEEALGNSARVMSEEEAKLFKELYDGKTDIEDYRKSFNLVTAYASNNYSQDTILKNKGVLTTEQVGKIYSATVIAKRKAWENKISKIHEKMGKGMSYKGFIDDSIIDYDNRSTEGKINWSSLKPRQRQAITFVKGIAKATGMNLKLTDEGFKTNKYNGLYVESRNTIVLDIYAGVDQLKTLEDTLVPTFSHELTHWMKDKSLLLYRKLDELVFKSLEERDGVSEDERISTEMAKLKKALGKEVTAEEARDEIIARACEDMLSMSKEGKKIFNSLSESEQKTFVDKIKDIIAKLKDWVTELLSTYDSRSYEAKLLREYESAINEMSKLWDEMLADAVKNNQAFELSGEYEHKKSTTEGDVKYSFRNSKSGMANDLLLPYGEELSRIIKQRGDYIVDSYESLKTIVNIAFDNPNKKATVYFGIIPTDVLGKIEKSVPNIPKELNGILFKPDKEYSVAATLDSIRHLRDDKNLSRNEVVEYLDRMSDTIVEFDTAYFDYYYHKGQKSNGILFNKTFSDGRMQSFEIVSSKKRTLNLQTIYMENGDYQKKKSANTLLMEKPSANVQDEDWSNFNDSITDSDKTVNTKFSLKDSDGRELSKGQHDYFKNSKVRDENGSLLVMYQGSSNDFTVFDRKKSKYSNLYGRGFYFTKSEGHAKQYGDTRAYYLDIKNPVSTKETTITKAQMLKFLEAVAENEDYGIENYGYGATPESVVESLYGKTDFLMLNDVSQTAIGDLIEAIELFNEVNGADFDGLILDTETVIFKSEQAKLTSNENPTDNEDIRFSMRENVEETKDLIAVHNLTPEKFLKSLKLGGLPMPSIAITRAREGHNSFGAISLVFHKDTIDPQFISKNKVYSGDAWTPTYPQVAYKVNEKEQEKIKRKIDSLVPSDVQRNLGGLHLDSTNIEDELNRHGGDMVASHRYNYAMKYAFLKDNNVDIELPTKEEPLYRYAEVSNSAVISFAHRMVEGLKTVNSLLEQHSSKLMDDIELINAISTVLNEEVMSTVDENTDAYKELVENPLFKPEDINLSTVLGMLEAARKYFHTNGNIEQKVDYKEAKAVIDEVIDQAEYEKWVNSLFADIVEKEGIRNNKDLFTPSGNRRSFEALHYEHNLENVIKAMKESGDKGIGGFGGGNIFGAATTEYGSISDMKVDAQKRMQPLPESQYEEIKKGFSDRFFELASSLPIHKDSFSAVDDAANMLVEAISKYKTKSGMANYLRSESKGWANYNDYVVDDLIQLVSEIRQMPVAYFEAKPQRAVGFDEVATAIIPDNTSAELKTMLSDNNINFVEYESGNDTARIDALNSLEDVKFSLRDDAYMDAVNKGDMETAQKMVDEAAKEAGYTVKAWHSTNSRFTVFDIRKTSQYNARGRGIYFSNAKDDVENNYASPDGADSWNKIEARAYELAYDKYGLSYEDTLTSEPDIVEQLNECYDEAIKEFTDTQRTIGAYLKFENALVINEDNKYDAKVTDEHDGIIDTTVYKSFGHKGMDEHTIHYIVLNPRHIKASDAVTYDDNGNVIPLSERFNPDNEDIRYSLRDDDLSSVHELMGEAERLKKENEKLKKDFEDLQERLKIERQVTNGNYFNENQLGAVAGHLRNISKSFYPKLDLVKRLKDVYSYIAQTGEYANGDVPTWEILFNKAYNIAADMLNDTKPEVEVNDYAKAALKDLRNRRISLSDNQIEEAKYRFGNNYNRMFFNKVIIAKDGIPLDNVWDELCDLYPTWFNKDTNEGDEIGALYDALEEMKAVSETIVEYNADERARWLAMEIYNQYWNVSSIKTTADKYDKQIKQLNFGHRKRIQTLREDYNARLKEQELELRWLAAKDMHNLKADKEKQLKEQQESIKSKYQQLAERIRENRDRKIAEAKEHGRERLAQYRENAERKTYVQRITQNALTLNELLVKNSKDKHIHESLKGPVVALLNAIDFSSKRLLDKGTPTKKDISLSQALNKVQMMMKDASVGKEELVELYGHGLDDDIKDLIDSVDGIMREIGDNEFILNKMTLTDLNTLDNMVRTIKHSVSKMNKFHVVHHAKGIANLSQESMEYLDSLGKEKVYDGLRGATKKLLNWNNALPYYAFKRYGNGGMKIYEALQDGWDKFAFNTKSILDYANEAYSSKEVKEWSESVKSFKLLLPAAKYEFNDPDYKPQYQTIQMTIPQIMSLYCLQKREQAKGHILGGGIRVADFKDAKGRIISQSDGVVITASDVATLIDALTDRQKAVADKLQMFMNTTCTDWGNEVSMLRFGYKAFGEENYFPIQSDDNNLAVNDATEQPNSLFRLLNMSFTKSTLEKANNRVVISDIFDVFAQHTSDMAKYNALALPVLDAFKWYNYTEKQDIADGAFKTTGVKQSIESAFGNDGKSYFTTFLKDINGQQEVGRDTLGKHFFTNMKIAAVGANLRVMALQPTSYVRASAVIDNKYLLKALGHKPKITHAEKHCGMALWKSMGYYDTNIQKGITDQIKHNDTWKDKAAEWSMKGAAVADKITWGYLWNACELEVRETRRDLNVGSNGFYEAIGKRLREIIYATQVVDSTMTRSQLMRGNGLYEKQLTAFASEPTLSYNMLQDAYMEYSLDVRRMGKKEAIKKNSKRIARVLTAYTLTNAVAALVESGFDAWRDDEEEDKNFEYFMKLYLSNFFSDMSITGKIPYIKELHSIVKGFGSSRSDTQWMESFTYALKGWYKIFTGEGTGTKAIKHSLKTVSDLSGLPFYSAYREIMSGLDNLEIFTAEDLDEIFEDFFN